MEPCLQSSTTITGGLLVETITGGLLVEIAYERKDFGKEHQEYQEGRACTEKGEQGQGHSGVCQKRPISVKRDLLVSKETY